MPYGNFHLIYSLVQLFNMHNQDTKNINSPNSNGDSIYIQKLKQLENKGKLPKNFVNNYLNNKNSTINNYGGNNICDINGSFINSFINETSSFVTSKTSGMRTGFFEFSPY